MIENSIKVQGAFDKRRIGNEVKSFSGPTTVEESLNGNATGQCLGRPIQM